MMYTGTSAEQDTRFSDKEKKLLKQMKFGECLSRRVDMSKVKLDSIKPWICKKITEVLGMDDDVVVEFVYNQLEGEKFPDPKKMQINLTGFLNGKNARIFMTDLWELLLSAQDSATGIPEQLIEMKKDEIKKKMEEQERLYDITKKIEREREWENERRRDRRHRSQSRDYHVERKDIERRKSRDRDDRKSRDRDDRKSRDRDDGKSGDRDDRKRVTSPVKHRSKNEDAVRKDSHHNETRVSLSPDKDDTIKQKLKDFRDGHHHYQSRGECEKFGTVKQKSKGADSRRSSSYSSPDYKRKADDFEIHKKEDSVQKKRHYRSNKPEESSSGIVERHESRSKQKHYEKQEAKYNYKSSRSHNNDSLDKRRSAENDDSYADRKRRSSPVEEKQNTSTDEKVKRRTTEKRNKYKSSDHQRRSDSEDDYDGGDGSDNESTSDKAGANDGDTDDDVMSNRDNDHDDEDDADDKNSNGDIDDDDTGDEDADYGVASTDDDQVDEEDEEEADATNRKRKTAYIDDVNEKYKKKARKHKKHKHKKKKVARSESSNEELDPDEIERQLREKALQSLRRRQ